MRLLDIIRGDSMFLLFFAVPIAFAVIAIALVRTVEKRDERKEEISDEDY